MKIGIDVRHLARGPFTGVAEVTRRLVEGIAELPGHEIRIFYNGRAAPPSFVTSWQEQYPSITVRAFRFSNRFLDAMLQATGRPKIDALLGGVDVFFSPHALQTPLSSPRVLVLHDISFVVRSDFFSPQSRMWHAMMRIKQQACKATGIIVPSWATARDLQRYWKVPQEKITVIPWAPPSAAKIEERRTRSSRNILFLGTVEKRKNVLGLVRAFELFKSDPRFHDVRLIIAGSMGWGSAHVRLATQSSKFQGDIELRDYVSPQEKQALLARAGLFVYPSFYEGFGLPVLEAMAHGVPVITSRTTSLPEVAGDAALLVNPRSPKEIADAMRLLFTEGALAQEFSHRSRERATQFSWETTAQRVLAVLEEVVSGKKKAV